MLLANAAHLQIIGHVLQTTLQGLAGAHQVFDVINAREPLVQQIEKVGLLRRQRHARYQLEQVAKVVPGVERDPLDILKQRKPGCNQHFTKVLVVDTIVQEPVKVEPGLGQELERVGRTHVVVHIEPEVELPCTGVRRKVSFLVAHRDTQLDQMQEIDVAAKCLVVIIGRSPEIANRARNDPRKLGILG